MNRDSVRDYLSCILIRLLGAIIRRLPLRVSFFLGRGVGDLLYYFDSRHKAIAYSNIKTAFAEKLPPHELIRLTRRFYRSLGENFIEILLTPVIDTKYIKKYVSFEGAEFIDQAFKKGKGVILLTVHAGSWELSNIVCAYLGFIFNYFVRDQQRYPRLNQLLNLYRIRQEYRVIQRENQLKQVIGILKKNEAVGMSVDQGGKLGELVKFFSKDASMATGAIKLALKYGSVIVPAFYARISGPYFKTILGSPFEVKKTLITQDDVRNNLQGIVSVFERLIRKYPADYFWLYKVWKYSDERNILILNDSRVGHLRQSQAVAGIVTRHLAARGIRVNVYTVESAFRNKLSRAALALSSCLSGKFACQGCLWCLSKFLKEHTYGALVNKKFDIIISCGSSLAPVNRVLSIENLAKSIAIMRPAFLSTAKFDLVIMSRHDHPPHRNNVVVTEGALNLIDEEYLKKESGRLIKSRGMSHKPSAVCIGLLIGGDSKGFSLGAPRITEVIRQIKSAAEKLDADILLTTSRRTSAEVEKIIIQEFAAYGRCKLMVIANEKNIPEAVGGILGLSQIIVVSPESISMVSEAVSSKKYVLVFKAPGLSRKHRSFLADFDRKRYIHMSEADSLGAKIEEIWLTRPPVCGIDNNLVVGEAIKRIL